MLVNPGYFFGEINIPNRSSVVVIEAIEDLIKIKEPEFLRDAIGVQMYDDLMIDIENPKYKKLIEGCSFVYQQKHFYWPGLANEKNNTSVIANYIYCAWQRNEWSTTYGSGEARSAGENSILYNPLNKIVSAHNKNVDSLFNMVLLIESDKSNYEFFRPNKHSDIWRCINSLGI